MISEHSTHSTRLPVGSFTWLWRYTCLLLILMLLHSQALFKPKGDKLSSSAECWIRTQGIWNRISGKLNARWQTDWANEDHAKNLNTIARPYDQWAFSPLDPTTASFRTWLLRYTCELLLILMLWHMQVVFESKGDMLSSSAECRIRNQGLWDRISSRMNAKLRITIFCCRNEYCTKTPSKHYVFHDLE